MYLNNRCVSRQPPLMTLTPFPPLVPQLLPPLPPPIRPRRPPPPHPAHQNHNLPPHHQPPLLPLLPHPPLPPTSLPSASHQLGNHLPLRRPQHNRHNPLLRPPPPPHQPPPPRPPPRRARRPPVHVCRGQGDAASLPAPPIGGVRQGQAGFTLRHPRAMPTGVWAVFVAAVSVQRWVSRRGFCRGGCRWGRRGGMRGGRLRWGGGGVWGGSWR